MINGL